LAKTLCALWKFFREKNKNFQKMNIFGCVFEKQYSLAKSFKNVIIDKESKMKIKHCSKSELKLWQLSWGHFYTSDIWDWVLKKQKQPKYVIAYEARFYHDAIDKNTKKWDSSPQTGCGLDKNEHSDWFLTAYHAIEHLEYCDGRTIGEAKNAFKKSGKNKIEIKWKYDQLIVRIIKDFELSPTPWTSMMDDNAGRMHVKEKMENIVCDRFLLLLKSPKIRVLEIIVVKSRVHQK
jgi:hypothetical protein